MSLDMLGLLAQAIAAWIAYCSARRAALDSQHAVTQSFSDKSIISIMAIRGLKVAFVCCFKANPIQ
jgi:hypothetical protein